MNNREVYMKRDVAPHVPKVMIVFFRKFYRCGRHVHFHSFVDKDNYLINESIGIYIYI